MRKSLLLAAAALTAGAIGASAQVYSANVVGYINVTCAAGEQTMIANQLGQTNTTLEVLIPAPPNGTSLLKWDGASYQVNNFDSEFGWDDPTMTLGLGEGAFVNNPGATDITITFVGEVQQGSLTNSIDSGLHIYSSIVPQAGLVQTDLGYAPSAGDSVLKWEDGAFAIYAYDGDFGWDPEPSIAVGESFFISTTTPKDWVRNFTVAP
jgi:hypothetical protein